MPSPMVVHCRFSDCHCRKYCVYHNSGLIVSAGVGRSGTFIAVDYSYQKLKDEEQVDIFNLVKEMREQRPLMVQTLVSVYIYPVNNLYGDFYLVMI